MGIELGKDSVYPDNYDASLLEPIPRALSRTSKAAQQYFGADYWTAFELSWLDSRGMPQAAWAEFTIPATSSNIIESKSFKYYLNSYNQTAFSSWDTVARHMTQDLSSVADGPVQVQLYALNESNQGISDTPGTCLDGLACDITDYTPNSALLICTEDDVTDEQLFTHLFKSNCPVTGQPDWATLWVAYSGKRIKADSLLKYLVSFRNHQGFHEACVEQIFSELIEHCSPHELCVYARYTRRGGLDINPYRVTESWKERQLPFGRLVRQ